MEHQLFNLDVASELHTPNLQIPYLKPSSPPQVNVTTGVISIVVGNVSHDGGASNGDGGPATDAGLRYALGITFDAAGNLFIAESGNGVVRKVSS